MSSFFCVCCVYRSILDLCYTGVLSGDQREPVHLPESHGRSCIPLQTPVPQRSVLHLVEPHAALDVVVVVLISMSPCLSAVTIAAVVIFMYAWLVPIGLWGFLTWRQGAERQIGGYSFLETVCVYGYSLFIYIPTSVSTCFLLTNEVLLEWTSSLHII